MIDEVEVLAAARSWVRSRGTVNVKADFGAAGDYAGSVNDSAAFQAAMTNRTLFGGGRIEVPAGNYDVRDGFDAADDIEIYLHPGAILNFGRGAISAEMIRAKGTAGTPVTVTADVVAGQAYALVASGAETVFTAGQRLKLQSTAVFDPDRTQQQQGQTLEVESVSDGRVNFTTFAAWDFLVSDTAQVVPLAMRSNVTITGPGKIVGGGTGRKQVGVACDTARDVSIEVDITGIEEKAIYAYDCWNVWFDKKTIDSANYKGTGYGFMPGWASENCGVRDATIKGCRHAFTVGGGASRKGVPRMCGVWRSEIHDSRSAGDALDTHAGAEAIFFVDDRIIDASNCGINIECAWATATGNTVTRPAKHGVFALNYTGRPTRQTIEDNTVINAGQFGVRATTQSIDSAWDGQIDWLKVNRNVSIRSTYQGILVDCRDPVFFFDGIEVNDNVSRGGGYSAQIQVTRARYGQARGNLALETPGNAQGTRMSSCVDMDARGNRARQTSLFDATSTTLSSAITGNETSFPVSSTAGVATKGAATIDGHTYSYTLTGGNLVVKRPIDTYLAAPLLIADTTAQLALGDVLATEDPYTGNLILIDNEVLSVTAYDTTTGIATLGARTSPADHVLNSQVRLTYAHASGAAVTFSAGSGALLTSCTDCDVRGSGGGGGKYGLKFDNNCANLIYDDSACHGADVRVSLGTGTGHQVVSTHASTHGSTGSDPITVAQSQVTGLATSLAAKLDATDASVTNARAPTAHASTHTLGGSDPIYLSSLGALFELTRTSDCSTLPPYLIAATSGTLTSGQVQAAVAINKRAHTYTQIRFMTGTTQPSGTYTDARAGVWDSAGTTKLDETANSVATVTLASTVYTLNLLSTGLPKAEGDVVCLGLGFIATTMPSIRGFAGASAIHGLGPASGAYIPTRSRTAGTWTTGNALPTLAQSGIGNVAWVELV